MIVGTKLKSFIQCTVAVLWFFVAVPTRADSVSPWQRVVVIGASASAGFTITEPFGGTNTLKCRLAYYWESALTVPHEPIRNYSAALLFLNPEGLGQQEVEVAAKVNPTLVLGVDFLFWYCYGDDLSDSDRRQRFDRGLHLLEQFQCPLVVGDIPDASYATNSGIISASQVPSAAVLSRANLRLRQWAETHTNVTIVPLSHLMKTINARQTVTCHGVVATAQESAAMVQDDHLHPTPLGAAWLALQTLDVFTAKADHGLAKDVRWKPSQVFKAGYILSQHPPPATTTSTR
jgi:hypothetical protein